MRSSRRPRSGRAAAVAGLGVALALLAAPLAGCAASSADGSSADASAEQGTATVASASSEGYVQLVDASSLFSSRDLDPSYSEVAATVTLSDAGSSADGSGVTVEGSTVTFTAGGTYVVTGSLSDGRLVVDVDDVEKVQLVLDGASVTSSTATALYVRSADKVFLTLSDGSSNSLAATGASTEEDDRTLDGTVFSRDDLTVNGEGSLSVSSALGHGVVAKDELTLVSGTLEVDAARHALQANDSVAVAGGSYSLVAGTDGIHCENADDDTLGLIYVGGGTIRIEAASDGLDASGVLQVDDGSLTVAAGDDGVHAELDVAVNGGTIDVTESYEALEGSTVTISGGTLSLVASDDGINATGVAADEGADGGAHWMGGGAGGAFEDDDTAWVLISGGTATIDAGGDGIDSNGDLTITGGETYVSGPTSGADGALDYAGEGTITGGVLVAVGSSQMAQNLGEGSTQVSMIVSASGQAGDAVTLEDASGTVLASFAPTKAYQSVVVSAPGVEVGQTYVLTCGSTETEVTPDSVSFGDVGMGAMGMGGTPGGMGAGGGMGDMPSDVGAEGGMGAGGMPDASGGPGGKATDGPSGVQA